MSKKTLSLVELDETANVAVCSPIEAQQAFALP